jgi:hypothetical protein
MVRRICGLPPAIFLRPLAVGISDLRAFITPFLQEGHILEVAAIATRVVSSLPSEYIFQR